MPYIGEPVTSMRTFHADGQGQADMKLYEKRVIPALAADLTATWTGKNEHSW